MSVDYEAFIGIGWVISAEEKERLIDANLKMIEEHPDEDIEKRRELGVYEEPEDESEAVFDDLGSVEEEES